MENNNGKTKATTPRANLHLSLTPELLDRLKQVAAQDERTVSNYTRKLLTDFLLGNKDLVDKRSEHNAL